MAIACFPLKQRSWRRQSNTIRKDGIGGYVFSCPGCSRVYVDGRHEMRDATWLSGQTMNQLTNVPEIRDLITGLNNVGP